MAEIFATSLGPPQEETRPIAGGLFSGRASVSIRPKNARKMKACGLN